MTDNWIYFYNYKLKKKYKASMSKNVIKNGKIADIDKFIHRYEEVLKENHLSGSVFGDKIIIVVHHKYTKADAAILKSIFEKMNYRDIKIIYEYKYYDMLEDRVWINYNRGYLLLTYIDDFGKLESFLIEEGFFESDRELYEYIKKRIKNRDIYIIGNSKKIDKFYQDFEKEFENKTYIFTTGESYILNRVIDE